METSLTETNEPRRGSPVFLVGAERSGTTLLRLMLDHHPEIAFQLEFEYAVGLMEDDGTMPEPGVYAQWLRQHLFFQDSGFEIDPSLGYRDLVRSFLKQKMERDGKSIVGATVHHHFDRLLYPWPEARFIHIVRDPRDVARSCIGMGWAGNVWTGVDRWLVAEKLWDGLSEKLDRTRYIEIRYEDLIRSPEETLGRLCYFLSVPFDRAMFSYAEKSTYDTPDPEFVFQWRKKSSLEEIRLVEAKTGKLLESRGYQRGGLPPLEIDEATKKYLRGQDKRACRKFRIDRYGLPLLVLAKIAGAVPSRFLKEKVQNKFNKIDREHMK